MAQTGYTPILIYSSTTAAAAPAVGNLTNSTLGSELAINITDGKLFYKDNANAIQVIGWKVVPVSAGGTGLTSYSTGDMLYYVSGTTLSKLAISTAGYYLKSDGSAPAWSAPAALTKTDDTNVTLTLGGSASTALLNAASLTLGWTGQLAATRGGTGIGSYAVGDLLYANTTTTLAKLADVATGNALISGGVGVAPSWGKIALTTHISGILPVANGGTNASSASITSFNNITGYTASGATGTTSTNLVFSTSPTLTTPIATTTIGVGNATPSASGAGITFPASQSASSNVNTLDDYEEGTYTPTWNDGTLTVQFCVYTKIGNQVYVMYDITFGSSVAATSAKVSVPFNLDTNYASGFINYTDASITSIDMDKGAGAGTPILFRPTIASAPITSAGMSTKRLIFAIVYTTTT